VTPYPQQGPTPPPHAPQTGGTWLVLLFVLVGVGAMIMVGGAVVWLALRAGHRARALPVSSATAEPTGTAPDLPPVTRRVPNHPLSILDGCSDADLDMLMNGIEDAIDIGAPLYNGGNFAGCYHLYDGAAGDLERKLPPACAGPVQALENGRKRAASLGDASSQAWAMRDAFDGLIHVVERRESRR
jgi:serine protease Do